MDDGFDLLATWERCCSRNFLKVVMVPDGAVSLVLNACEPRLRSAPQESPKVGVILPAYNAAPYLAATLDSLLAQSHRNLEIIVVDDCSADGTILVANRYASKDARVRVVRHETNQGPPGARNTAISHLSSDVAYVMNHDSDDLSLPTKVAELLEYLCQNEHVDAVGSMADYIDFSGKYVGRPQIEWIPERVGFTFAQTNSMIVSATLMRRSMLDAVAPFNVRYRVVDDYDFFARALIKGYVLANIPKVLHRIRLHPTSIGALNGQRMADDSRRIARNYKQAMQDLASK